MEQGTRRGSEICARDQMADCPGRDGWKSERMEGGGEEALRGPREITLCLHRGSVGRCINEEGDCSIPVCHRLIFNQVMGDSRWFES